MADDYRFRIMNVGLTKDCNLIIQLVKPMAAGEFSDVGGRELAGKRGVQSGSKRYVNPKLKSTRPFLSNSALPVCFDSTYNRLVLYSF